MSSKLLDATQAVTSAVPWLAGFKEPNHDAVPLQLEGQSRTPVPEEQVQELVGEEMAPVAVEIVADHSECESRAGALQGEIERLGVQIVEERRVAYQQGFEAGTAQESAKWAEAVVRSAKSVAELAGYKPRMRAQVEADAVRLALAIARKVLHREANTDPEAIAGLVRVALEKVSIRDVLRIRVCAKDASELKGRLAEYGLPSQVELVLDQSLERGGVVIDTEQGHVDASIDTQLHEIERGLADALDRERRR